MEERIHFISINTENSLSVLQRIASILSRYRVNIEQLTVFETSNRGVSHFNLVVHGTKDKITKIVKKLANVVEVIDIKITGTIPVSGYVDCKTSHTVASELKEVA
jgi:acetolactate synthase-1/3 small subunit